MPTNASGVPIEAAPYNVGDGFSPGSVITLKIPGIETAADVAATGAVPINHLGRYKATNAPVVVIDASTGRRWPIWVEIDSTVKSQFANVEIHPAVNFTSGHRYIVALRNLKNAAKHHLQAPAGFRYYRDDLASLNQNIGHARPVNIALMIIDLPSSNNDSLRKTHSNPLSMLKPETCAESIAQLTALVRLP